VVAAILNMKCGSGVPRGSPLLFSIALGNFNNSSIIISKQSTVFLKFHMIIKE
jgi:hypothetical protein